MPSKYTAFIDHDGEIDFDREMKRIRQAFQSILAGEAQSQAELKQAFKGLGYEI